jgi:hypothetical protein
MIIQKSQNCIRLLFLKPNNIPRKLFVDKDCFGAGDGMNADDGVDVGDWFTAHMTSRSTGVGGLFETGVDCGESFKELLEGGG